MERGHRPVGRQAIDFMRIPERARCLDVGCGSAWATRLMAALAWKGSAVGVDISDEMVNLARAESKDFKNVSFEVASAENLPFSEGSFTHAFSMESIYYYADMRRALTEIERVLDRDGLFVCVVDLYKENEPSLQWVDQLKVPVHVLGVDDYRDLFRQAGFVSIEDRRLYDPTPPPDEYSGGSFKSKEDLVRYKQLGSLMIVGSTAR